MTRKEDRAEESQRIAFLAMFFARTHRMLYRAQYVGDLGEEMGLSDVDTRACAVALRQRGWLRELSTLAPRGPLMEITQAGISAVQSSISASARAGNRAE